ncbi:MAG TPA: site-2 protease family protein [Nitrosopumilaceae archaeon]|nr:site-2 protease family protein [Nitrosopumilaceae archaeon]
MSEPTQEEVISIVSSVFEIKSVNQNLDVLQFEIEREGFKPKFVKLAQSLESKNLVGRLEKFEDRVFLFVGRFHPPRLRRAWIPRILFAATIAVVMIDGYYRTLETNSIVMIGDPLEMAGLYTVSLIGILGIHELGHIIASKWHKIKTSWPYFIPGIPIIGFIPTFGALIMSRSFTINRDILFDIGISGPIAGLIVAVVVSIYGAYLSPVIPESQAQQLISQSQLFEIHESVIMKTTEVLAGKYIIGTEIVYSPVLLAAWFGFLITFLNLLPAWQLDGGHIARATLGRKWHKITTYAGIGILAILGFWFMALFVLSFSMRSPDVRPLDDISPLSSKRKKLFVLVIGLAVVCAPLPFSILP